MKQLPAWQEDAPGTVKYPVGGLVSDDAFRDGGGCRCLVQVGAVIIQQKLVSQRVQLWTRPQATFIIYNIGKCLGYFLQLHCHIHIREMCNYNLM